MIRVEMGMPIAVYNHPIFSREINWAHNLMNIPAAWATTTGRGVKVGVVDTGCDYTHIDLLGKIFGGINCTVHGAPDYKDVSGHGTSCASIIAARKTGKGVAGVAPDASLFIAKAVDDAGVGEAEFLKCAIQSCIDAGCQVINMSLGSAEPYPEVEATIEEGVNKNIIFVAAAGNSGDITVKDNDGYPLEDWPARLPYVISVAAMDKEEQVPEWSSPGHVEFAAPGVDVVTCYPGNKYATFSGTSQAAPFVSGVCALLRECDPGVDFNGAVQILSKYSLHIGDGQRGGGLINVGSAINAFAVKKG